MSAIRFGNVVAYKYVGKDLARGFVSPQNRVLMDGDTAYLINGAEDIQTVDDMFTHLRKVPEGDNKQLTVINGINRFLQLKAFGKAGDDFHNWNKPNYELLGHQENPA